MERLTDFVLAHKRIVVGLWIVLTVVGFALTGRATEAMDQQVNVPGREGWQASTEIAEKFGNGGETQPLLAVVKLPEGANVTDRSVRSELRDLEKAIGDLTPGARIAGYGSTGETAFISDDGRVALTYVFPAPSDNPFGGNEPAAKKLAEDLKGATVDGESVRVTGYDALNASSGEGEGSGLLIEALVAGLAALIVLIFVFRSFVALAPLMMAICAIPTAFLMLLGLSTFAGLSPILQFLVALVGLGVSIDYSLLVVVRWREERDAGLSNEDAVKVAMNTAGKAVVFSGTTVAVGLLALVALPLPFLRSMGYGGLLIPLVATVVAITLLPVVLASIGPALDKHRIRRGKNAGTGWERWSRWVVKRRVFAAIASAGVLLALLIPATKMNLGNPDPDTMAKAGEAKIALGQMQTSGIGAGAIAPTETIVPVAGASAVQQAQAEAAGVHGASAPEGSAWQKDGEAVVLGIPVQGDNTQAGRDAVDALTSAAHGASPDARVGGIGPQNRDFIDAVYGSFPLVIAILSLLTFLLLARAFRSLLLPLKAVLLNILSIGATIGVMTLIWQEGYGSEAIWGIPATGAITTWIPFMVFALLYGLSMDYEVFILSRMREEYDKTGDTDEAIVRGLSSTGRLVTSAAIILFFAFASLASGPQVDIKVLATGLAIGIILDATIIRAMLVPATVSLFGKWNWWLPRVPAKLLRVKPSEAQARQPSP